MDVEREGAERVHRLPRVTEPRPAKRIGWETGSRPKPLVFAPVSLPGPRAGLFFCGMKERPGDEPGRGMKDGCEAQAV